MAINFAYFRRHTKPRRWRDVAVFVVSKGQLLGRSPYRVLSELVTIATDEEMRLDDSLLVVLDRGKHRLYGDTSLVDLVLQTGVPRYTHTMIA